MATIAFPDYEWEFDFSQPLFTRLGGRFPTREEVETVVRVLGEEAYEYLSMGLRRLHEEAAHGERTVSMSSEELVALIEAARDARYVAEKLESLARRIENDAWALWNYQEDKRSGRRRTEAGKDTSGSAV